MFVPYGGDSLNILTSFKYLTELEMSIPEEATCQLSPNSLPQLLSLTVTDDWENCLICLANACPNLRKLSLSSESCNTVRFSRAVREFVRNCPQLEYVKIDVTDEDDYEYDSDEEDQTSEVVNLDKVFENAWNYLPNLEFVKLSGDCCLSKSIIRKMISSSKNLLGVISHPTLYIRSSATAQDVFKLGARGGYRQITIL